MPKDFYVYAIRHAGPRQVFKQSSIDQIGEIFVVQEKGLEVVVSQVDAEKYKSKEIQEKAQQDVQWIVEHAKRHQAVVEEAMVYPPVIPMKFGTLFKSKNKLEKLLKDDHERFLFLLGELEGHQEWNVRVSVDPDSLKEHLKSKKIYLDAGKHLDEVPKGMEYFEELKLEELLEDMMREWMTEAREKILSSLDECVSQKRENSLQAAELQRLVENQEKVLRALCNNVYLIQDDQLNMFSQHIEQIRQKYPSVIIEVTGPWPPYNFLEIGLYAPKKDEE